MGKYFKAHPDEYVNIYKSDGISLIASVLAPDDYNVANSKFDIGGHIFNLPATDGLTVPIVDTDLNPVSSTFSGGNIVIDTKLTLNAYFFDQEEGCRVDINALNQGIYTSGSGANIGTIQFSTDNITFIPFTLPWTPAIGTYYFKRGTALITAIYTIIGQK